MVKIVEMLRTTFLPLISTFYLQPTHMTDNPYHCTRLT